MQEIRTEHLTVGYDKTPLIGDVNLSVRPGEILTLIGPNGSGKSTILKTITKQLKKLDGTVFLGEASRFQTLFSDQQFPKIFFLLLTYAPLSHYGIVLISLSILNGIKVFPYFC